MRLFLASLLVLSVGTVSVAAKKKIPPRAQVVMTGKGTGFVNMKVLKMKILAATIMVNQKTEIVVSLPDNAFQLKDESGGIDKMVAVEGVLTTTDHPVLGASINKSGHIIPLLTAIKVTQLNEKNKKDFPTLGNAMIVGIANKRKTKVGSKNMEWALQNGKSHIPFTLAIGGKLPKAGTKVRVSGKIRVVAEKLALEEATIEAVKK
jgi:hypothetical protein